MLTTFYVFFFFLQLYMFPLPLAFIAKQVLTLAYVSLNPNTSMPWTAWSFPLVISWFQHFLSLHDEPTHSLYLLVDAEIEKV